MSEFPALKKGHPAIITVFLTDTVEPSNNETKNSNCKIIVLGTAAITSNYITAISYYRIKRSFFDYWKKS